jgi:hypothetical protein
MQRKVRSHLFFSFVSNDVDVIVFSVHEHGYQKNCGDDPIGTYIAPVPYFLDGYIRELATEAEDQGYDYEAPDVAQYIQCTAFAIDGVQYYFQFGCADGTSQALAVNIYTEETCTTRSDEVDGWDDSTLDVSGVKVGLQSLCVSLVTSYSILNQSLNLFFDQSFPSKGARPVSTGLTTTETLTMDTTSITKQTLHFARPRGLSRKSAIESADKLVLNQCIEVGTHQTRYYWGS